MIERIRNRDSGANLQALGRDMAQVLTMEDSEKEETAETISERLQEGLAKELGVDEDEINTQFIQSFATDFVNIKPEDVLTEQSLIEHDLLNTDQVLEELEQDLEEEESEEDSDSGTEEEENTEETDSEEEEEEEESPTFSS